MEGGLIFFPHPRAFGLSSSTGFSSFGATKTGAAATTAVDEIEPGKDGAVVIASVIWAPTGRDRVVVVVFGFCLGPRRTGANASAADHPGHYAYQFLPTRKKPAKNWGEAVNALIQKNLIQCLNVLRTVDIYTGCRLACGRLWANKQTF